MAQIIFAEKIYTGKSTLENQFIVVETGKIVSISPHSDATPQTTVTNLCAGIIDIHINGGSGLYFTQWPTVEAVQDIDASSAALGTAYTLPTLVTSPLDNILRGIDAVRAHRKQFPTSGVVGMHLEGPFINIAKRGAHLPQFIAPPTDDALQTIIRRGDGILKLITIAPELFSTRQIAMLAEAGIIVSAGHSNATYEQAQKAFAEGINLVTHLYNAMSPFTHRAPGLVGAALANDNVYAPIIMDGAHSHFAAARVAAKSKRDKLFLISDALFTGDAVKHFAFGEFNATLTDGKYVNSEGNLAGGAISLGDCIRNAVAELHVSVQEAVEMATSRPAAALRISDSLGHVAPGFPAVFTVFDDSLSTFNVLRYN